MTRQPAAEKRFTVACPMPRLAPVSSSVRRGWLVCGFTITMRFQGYIRVLVHAPPNASRRNSTRSCSLNGRSCQNSIFIGTMR